ncbi:hypothetical protein [Flavobacterium sp. DSP2-3-1]|uniref:hypothetical protein n=1 Tax=Flavobacterium sp. DSP2-3-1 TaxID=2804620 RepID=UPI003CF90F0A
MIELSGLKSFQQILFWLFLVGIIIGVLLTLYFINQDKFRLILLLPSLPVLYFISKGLYKNSNSFFMDLKSITTKA